MLRIMCGIRRGGGTGHGGYTRNALQPSSSKNRRQGLGDRCCWSSCTLAQLYQAC